jgi:HlyD family secretion protein
MAFIPLAAARPKRLGMNQPLRHDAITAWDEPGIVDAPAPSGAASRRGRAMAALVFLVAAGTLVTVGIRANRPAPVAKSPGPTRIIALGRIEPASRVVRLAAPGSPDAARVLALNVSEGDRVSAGQVLAVLDSHPKLAAQVEASTAQVMLRQVQLQRQTADLDSARRQRRAQLDRAQAELTQAQADFDRQLALGARGVGTAADLDQKKRALATATGAVDEARALHDRIMALAADGDQAEGLDVAVARRELAAAEASLALARISLADAEIRAPFSGEVIAIAARPGERVGSDGLLELAAVDRMEAILEVDERDVQQVSPGQTVRIRADAVPGPILGRVTRIGRHVRRQTVVNSEPAAATDARVVEVTASFEAVTSRALSRLSHLQVVGVFEP